MNDEHFEQLIGSHLHVKLSPEQCHELKQRLLHSAADSERFWQEAETYAMLRDPPKEGAKKNRDESSVLWLFQILFAEQHHFGLSSDFIRMAQLVSNSSRLSVIEPRIASDFPEFSAVPFQIPRA